MLKIYSTRLFMDAFELPEEFQLYLDKITREGEVFRVEEYYDNTMTIIVTDDVYLYATKEVDGKTDGYNRLPVECSLSKARSMDDLYKTMLKRRVVLDIDEIRNAYAEIEGYVSEKGITL